MPDLLDPDIRIMRFLSDKMEATGAMIGKAVAPGRARSDRGYAMIGCDHARHLQDKGMLLYLPELRAWRLSAEGRKHLAPEVKPTPSRKELGE